MFAADFRVHAQRITVDVATQVTLGQRTAEVEQTQSYTVAYEPVDRLTIAVPRALAAAKRLSVLCDGKPVTPVGVADEPAGKDPAAPVSMRVALPRPRIGTCDLVLQYSTAVTEPTPQHSSTLALPLPMPQDGQLAANSLTVKGWRNTRASTGKEAPWTVVEREAAASRGPAGLSLTADKRVYRLDLDLRWEADDTAGATIVDRAWVQSWFSSSARQDRAAYQLTTDRKELEVLFPPGAEADQAVVLVNGKRVAGRTIGEDRLLVPLSGPHEERRCTIELLYQFSGPRPPRGALQLEFPAHWPRRVGAADVLATRPARQRTRHRQPGRLHQRVRLGLARILLGTAAAVGSVAIGVLGRRHAAAPAARAGQPLPVQHARRRPAGRTAHRRPDVDRALGLGRRVGGRPAADLRARQPAPGHAAGRGHRVAGRRVDRARAHVVVGPGRQPRSGAGVAGRAARTGRRPATPSNGRPQGAIARRGSNWVPPTRPTARRWSTAKPRPRPCRPSSRNPQGTPTHECRESMCVRSVRGGGGWPQRCSWRGVLLRRGAMLLAAMSLCAAAAEDREPAPR